MRVVSIESCAQRLKISLTDKINFDYRLFAPKFFPRRRTGVKACRFIDNRLKITRFREGRRRGAFPRPSFPAAQGSVFMRRAHSHCGDDMFSCGRRANAITSRL
jgi:hypothetical protein